MAFLGPRDYSMRVWLDPERLASLQMTTTDVIKAIQEQNVQVAAGRIGQPPVPAGAAVPFDLPINTQGRLLGRGAVREHHRKDRQPRGRTSTSSDVVRKPKYDDKGNVIAEAASNWAPRTTT